MGFSRQGYWSGLPCPSPGDLPDPGIEPTSLISLALAGGSLPLAPRGKPIHIFGSSFRDQIGFPGSTAGKESACNAGYPSSIPGLGRSAGEGIGYSLQSSSGW